ncbi:rRNA maturation RNase YbeY [Bauldia sp.]|uniref:rRNA maturation RNase YbeY n=1 Tax=Bauldia sp. TaxID=2575872 RepID=UPI003BA91A9D
MPAADRGATGLSVETIFEDDGWETPHRLRSVATKAAIVAARRTGNRLTPTAELAIVFADDAMVRDLNRRFRGKDQATNILSFPAGSGNAPFGPLLGDLILARETIRTESETRGVVFEAHLSHLIVHGFLHLVGYDHETDAEALLMEGLETSIMGDLGLADPYCDDERQQN